MGSDLANAADLLRSATDVTLLAHVSPDADALGSALALALGLRTRGARVRVAFGAPADISAALRALDPAGLLIPADEVPAAPATLVVLDCGSERRLGPLADRVATTKAAGGRVLVIDHHIDTPRFGTDHVLDEHAEATAVLVAALLDELGIPLDADIATCVYAGVLTDTGSFRRATPSTHRLAARLLEAGARPDAIARSFDAHPFPWLRMLSTVLGRAQLVPDAAGGLGLVYAVVTIEDLADLRPEDVEGVIDLLRASEEAEVAAVAKELEPGVWTVSLRAVGAVDVRAAAIRLGGGGHRLAAGFTARGSAEDVLVSIKRALD
ncbi:FIG146085: 3'-to-5' oligoribonuclease A, Bacillus type [Alloactinosynnema sp. L-07]|uniref:DHH family phosphoesterase n=1 Tax=Alloactinosynnema sp. L-07 TaxID=1653480 RepID=UPI00065EF938|nr:DHH family phosphoesterase [Alloactinosynnema sp. L-07]CRK58535.1 FIG146085: 3'-to-5' oligoribonuclease A, Bacillus type [Alloactinosynnema sp. L-07]